MPPVSAAVVPSAAADNTGLRPGYLGKRHSLALIVHPKFGRDLRVDMSIPASWADLPDEVLLRIGQLLDDGPSLLRLGQVNTHCRYYKT